MKPPRHHPVPGLAIAAATLVTASLVPAYSQGHADEIEQGRALAERLCAVCHLNPGQAEKAGASEVPGFVAVANRPGQTLRGIVDWLKSVPPMMPDHHLSQDEMFALAAYILSLRK